jgi:Na+-translocating ferredoxin:NAD+ oxidoreductase RnfD subunit
METEVPEEGSKPFSLLRCSENIVGAGIHLLLLGLLLEGVTLIARRWISFPISLTFETQLLLTFLCLAACL